MICELCGVKGEHGDHEKHHSSYYPEETVIVCRSCHQKIHKKDGFHDDLKPDMDRPDDYETERNRLKRLPKRHSLSKERRMWAKHMGEGVVSMNILKEEFDQFFTDPETVRKGMLLFDDRACLGCGRSFPNDSDVCSECGSEYVVTYGELV